MALSKQTRETVLQLFKAVNPSDVEVRTTTRDTVARGAHNEWLYVVRLFFDGKAVFEKTCFGHYIAIDERSQIVLWLCNKTKVRFNRI